MEELTLSAWIRIPTYVQEKERSGWMIMEKRPHDGCWELLHFDQGRLLLRGASITANISERGTVELDKWVHVAGTIRRGASTLYVNGAAAGSAAVTPVRPSGGEIYIGMGRNWHASDDQFKGFMDDVMIFNRALSADEVQTVFLAR
jgi:hypothetical protein